MSTCVARCKNTGLPCDKGCLPGSRFCYIHDQRPEVAERRRQGGVLGGKNRRKRVSKHVQPLHLESAADLRGLFLWLVRELVERRMDLMSAKVLTPIFDLAVQSTTLPDLSPQARRAESHQPPSEFAALAQILKTTEGELLPYQVAQLQELVRFTIEERRKGRERERWGAMR